MQGKKSFSKLGFNARYHQGWVAADDIETTVFVRPDGLWE
jgi:hypothetical protein